MNKEQYIATVYEMLDELDWGLIDWNGTEIESDREDFKQLLGDAWDRCKKHHPMTSREHAEAFLRSLYPGGEGDQYIPFITTVIEAVRRRKAAEEKA